MEEIKELHTRSLEWGCICNLIDKISDIEESIDGHWDALLDMIADVVSEESGEKDTSTVFFYIYEFFFRLYYRLRSNPSKRDFNIISKATVSGKDTFRVTNYDYKTFKWARLNGFICEISNDYIDLETEKLTEKQQRAFSRRIK